MPARRIIGMGGSPSTCAAIVRWVMRMGKRGGGAAALAARTTENEMKKKWKFARGWREEIKRIELPPDRPNIDDASGISLQKVLKMTNVSSAPRKLATRQGLFRFAVEALEGEGWAVSRVLRGGKASLRQIQRGQDRYRVSIRTSQDGWIAFPPKRGGAGWVTLDDVDFVVAVSVNDKHDPTEARVHMIPGDEARRRFNRAYAARKAAGHTLPEGRGVWLSLYEEELDDPPTRVGGGMGLQFKALAVRDLRNEGLPTGIADEEEDDDDIVEVSEPTPPIEAPLTIGEAKRRLAQSLGVPESAIRITIEH